MGLECNLEFKIQSDFSFFFFFLIWFYSYNYIYIFHAFTKIKKPLISRPDHEFLVYSSARDVEGFMSINI